MDKETSLHTLAEGGCELFLRHIASIAELTAADNLLIGSLPVTTATIADNHEIVREGAHPQQCFLVLEGLVANVKLVRGGHRQIASFCLPGDMPDLQNLYLAEADTEFRALTPSKVGFIAHAAITDICRKSEGISQALWRMSLIDGAIFREWVTNIGQRSSHERVGHLFCEMFIRLKTVGLTHGYSYFLPVTQNELSEAVGMSPVHVNRVLQQLRRDKLIKFEAGRLTILDWPGLVRASGFEPDYLHLLPRGSAA